MLENDKNMQSDKNENSENEAKLKENTRKQFFDYWNRQVTLEEIAIKNEWTYEFLKPIDTHPQGRGEVLTINDTQ